MSHPPVMYTCQTWFHMFNLTSKHTPACSYLGTSSTGPLASPVLDSLRPHDRGMDTHSRLFIISSHLHHRSNWLPTFVRIIKVHWIQSNHCHVTGDYFNRIIGPTFKHLALSKGHKWSPDAVVDRSSLESIKKRFTYDAKPSVILLGPKNSTYQLMRLILSCLTHQGSWYSVEKQLGWVLKSGKRTLTWANDHMNMKDYSEFEKQQIWWELTPYIIISYHHRKSNTVEQKTHVFLTDTRYYRNAFLEKNVLHSCSNLSIEVKYFIWCSRYLVILIMSTAVNEPELLQLLIWYTWRCPPSLFKWSCSFSSSAPKWRNSTLTDDEIHLVGPVCLKIVQRKVS